MTERNMNIMSRDDATGQNWSDFRPGDRVTVAEFRKLPYEATVVLTGDVGTVWVLPDSGYGRKVFDCREDVVIRHSQTMTTSPGFV
jgi:hypothetical protein